MKHITINDRGVFVTETTPLSPQAIYQKRRKIERHIVFLRGKVQDSKMEIQRAERDIVQEQERLSELNSPVVEAYLEEDKRKRQEYFEKARKLLRELIGDELFIQLEDKKKIIFEAKDKQVYKLESNGNIFRKTNKQWLRLCIIRPETLPLPDFLLSLFVSIRESPQSYRLRRR